MRSLNARWCYFLNFTNMIAQKRGHAAAAGAGVRLLISELVTLSRFAQLHFRNRQSGTLNGSHPEVYSDSLMAELTRLPIELSPYTIDADAFKQHIAMAAYPPCYAGGPVEKGGAREKKLLEYFISLDLLDVQAEDVVIDVGSEWSVFPEVLQQLSGATVYRQDLIYPPGVNSHYIGGSAANMPVQAEFADKLVLHNAFEHFEGTADTDFIVEAWRVLRPGGRVCILPLYLNDGYCILTDPLLDRNGVVWDEGAEIVEMPGWHNRFGRFYDPQSLSKRVIEPALRCGFRPVLGHITNIKTVIAKSRLHFALVLFKPDV